MTPFQEDYKNVRIWEWPNVYIYVYQNSFSFYYYYGQNDAVLYTFGAVSWLKIRPLWKYDKKWSQSVKSVF